MTTKKMLKIRNFKLSTIFDSGTKRSTISPMDSLISNSQHLIYFMEGKMLYKHQGAPEIE